MEPSDFATRDEFEGLSDEEALAYFERLRDTLMEKLKSAHPFTQVEFAEHYYDVLEWTLPPEDYERLVRRPLSDTLFENVEVMRDALLRVLASPDVPASEKQKILPRLDQVLWMTEHKRDLDDLAETGDHGKDD
jgi:hypothetical protein